MNDKHWSCNCAMDRRLAAVDHMSDLTRGLILGIAYTLIFVGVVLGLRFWYGG